MKPLGGKAYGSIPHLLGSKLGPGDHTISDGQHKICTEKTRDMHDFIIVQVKYDGSNCSIANIDGKIVALTRKGYTAESSPFEQHHVFARWVNKNIGLFSWTLKPGERICGEWLYQAHGIRYNCKTDPFVAFDYFDGGQRLCYEDFYYMAKKTGLATPRILACGNRSFSIDSMFFEAASFQHLDFFQSIEQPEGLIYRVERKGKVDFLAKWVRSDFETGKYLPFISGQKEVFNYETSI